MCKSRDPFLYTHCARYNFEQAMQKHTERTKQLTFVECNSSHVTDISIPLNKYYSMKAVREPEVS